MEKVSGLLRLKQIIGDPKADPPEPAIIPISRSSWLEGVRKGRFPKPIKLGPRTTCWRYSDIVDFIENAGKPPGAEVTLPQKGKAMP